MGLTKLTGAAVLSLRMPVVVGALPVVALARSTMVGRASSVCLSAVAEVWKT